MVMHHAAPIATFAEAPTYRVHLPTMYIPRPFQESDREEALRFIQAHSFGLLTTNGSEVPMATHLPFTTAIENDALLLSSHLAALNPQSQVLDGALALVVFSEPHAYVSPGHYERKQNVPTWNYVAVHCTGRVVLARDHAERIRILERMIATYEASYQKQWEALPQPYREGLLNELEAFTVRVEKLEACYKLSQDKKTAEQARISDHLQNHGGGSEQALAAYMKRSMDRRSGH